MIVAGESGSGRRWRNGALSLLLCVVLQEFLLRFFFPLPEIKGFNRIDYMPVGLENRETTAIRSIRVVQESSPDGVSFSRSLNEYGFRGGRWRTRKAAGVVRTLFVGDSFVESDLVPDGLTIPEAYQAAAKRAGVSIEAMNLGVTGAGLASDVRLIVDTAPVFRPDQVFLVVYANDLPDQLDVPVPRTFGNYRLAKPRFVELVEMALKHEQLPWRWSWRETRFDQPVPSPSNPWSDRTFAEQNLRQVSPRMLAEMKAGRFNAFRVGGSRALAAGLQEPFDISGALAELRTFLAGFGATFAVIYIPERGTVTNHYRRFEQEYSLQMPKDTDLTGPAFQLHRRLLSAQCAAAGVPFFDSAELVRAAEDAGRHVYFDFDDHLNGAGGRFLGEAIFAWWSGAAPGSARNQSPGRLKM